MSLFFFFRFNQSKKKGNSQIIIPERYLLDSYNEPLYFEDIEEAAKCVADIVGHTIETSVEAIDQALDDYLTEHEDNDTC